MASAFRVSLDGHTDLRRRLEQLGAEMPRVATRAINYAGGKAQTKARRDIAGDLGIPQYEIRRHVRFRRADFRTLSGELGVSGRVRVHRLGAHQLLGGVQAGRRFYRSAFLQTMPRSGHTGAFERLVPSTYKAPGAARRTFNLPIKELFERSQDIFESRFLEAAISAGRDDLVREAERQMALLLNGGKLPNAPEAA